MFSWYKYLIVSLVFSHLGFWSGSLFLIAPFPDLCLLVLFLRPRTRLHYLISCRYFTKHINMLRSCQSRVWGMEHQIMEFINIISHEKQTYYSPFHSSLPFVHLGQSIFFTRVCNLFVYQVTFYSILELKQSPRCQVFLTSSQHLSLGNDVTSSDKKTNIVIAWSKHIFISKFFAHIYNAY